jgi:hypothetical protein
MEVEQIPSVSGGNPDLNPEKANFGVQVYFFSQIVLLV